MMRLLFVIVSEAPFDSLRSLRVNSAESRNLINYFKWGYADFTYGWRAASTSRKNRPHQKKRINGRSVALI
jgi:hypothetical protein